MRNLERIWTGTCAATIRTIGTASTALRC